MNLNSSITSPYNMHVPQIYQQYNLKYEELNNRLTKVKKEFGMRRAISSRSLTGETVRVWRMYLCILVRLHSITNLLIFFIP